MTQADKNFIEICKEILKNGYSSKGTNMRTKWKETSRTTGIKNEENNLDYDFVKYEKI